MSWVNNVSRRISKITTVLTEQCQADVTAKKWFAQQKLLMPHEMDQASER